MADKKDNQFSDFTFGEDESGQEKPQNSSNPKRGLMFATVAVVFGVGMGIVVTILTNSPAEAPADAIPDIHTADKEGEQLSREEVVYVDFDPVTVTLDVPRGNRYLRATLTVAIPKKYADEATELVRSRKPELDHWLIVYLSGCTLEQVRGSTNLNRIRREIATAFNRNLWPDREPRIDHVLFREFAIN